MIVGRGSFRQDVRSAYTVRAFVTLSPKWESAPRTVATPATQAGMQQVLDKYPHEHMGDVGNLLPCQQVFLRRFL